MTNHNEISLNLLVTENVSEGELDSLFEQEELEKQQLQKELQLKNHAQSLAASGAAAASAAASAAALGAAPAAELVAAGELESGGDIVMEEGATPAANPAVTASSSSLDATSTTAMAKVEFIQVTAAAHEQQVQPEQQGQFQTLGGMAGVVHPSSSSMVTPVPMKATQFQGQEQGGQQPQGNVQQPPFHVPTTSTTTESSPPPLLSPLQLQEQQQRRLLNYQNHYYDSRENSKDPFHYNHQQELSKQQEQQLLHLQYHQQPPHLQQQQQQHRHYNQLPEQHLPPALSKEHQASLVSLATQAALEAVMEQSTTEDHRVLLEHERNLREDQRVNGGQQFNPSQLMMMQQQHQKQLQHPTSSTPPPTNSSSRLQSQQMAAAQVTQEVKELDFIYNLVDGTFKCPREGCEKLYKNRNGLKYHLTQGSCEGSLEMVGSDGNLVEGAVLPAGFTPPAPKARALPRPRSPRLLQSDFANDPEAYTKYKPFYCKICSKRYKNINGLRYHGKADHAQHNFKTEVEGLTYS